MKICIIGKYPPICGGVSAQNYWLARCLAERGYEVHIVTNADEVEDNFRILLTGDDREWYEPNFEKGFVKLWKTGPLTAEYRHIPQSNPFVTKLASIATNVAKRESPEVIFSYYLEPYAVAAYLVSSWTGIPFIVRHAGSDAARLMKIEDLAVSYREIVRKASLVATCEELAGLFFSIGVESQRIYIYPGFIPLSDYFNPMAQPLDISAFLSDLSKSPEGSLNSSPKWHTNPIDKDLPTIGVYGKLGEAKGSFDLLQALSNLKRRGMKFNLVALAHGWPQVEDRFREAVTSLDLVTETRILPFLPPWRIPSFLTSLTAACFLERDFPIRLHSPMVPMEVMACGTCLLMSLEIALKQQYCNRLVHGINSFIVRDPRDHGELEGALGQILDNPDRAQRIGKRGHLVVRPYQESMHWLTGNEMMLNIAKRGPGKPMQREHERENAARLFARLFPVTKMLLSQNRESRCIREPAGVSLNSLLTQCDCEISASDDERSKAEKILRIVAAHGEDKRAKPDLVTEVMRWEVAQSAHRRETLHPEMTMMLFRHLGADIETLDAENVLHSIPVIPDYVALEEFAFDMEKIVIKIKEGCPGMSDVETEQAYYLFVSSSGRSKPTVLRIGYEIYGLLKKCDGCKTLCQIIGETESLDEAVRIASNRRDKLIKRALHFFSEGILSFRVNS